MKKSPYDLKDIDDLHLLLGTIIIVGVLALVLEVVRYLIVS